MLLHRRPGASPIGESQAYAHLHGARSGAVTIVTAEPRLPRYKPRASGEQLRRRFEEKLDTRPPSSRKAARSDER